MFRFKQFLVHDDRCAMKVGTDGVLLGAWTECESGVSRILDVGAGCGLVALMLAQRYPGSHITAIEIDADAASQAQENVDASPFKNQIEVIQRDFLDVRLNSDDVAAEFFLDGEGVDAIVSNPPFFEEEVLPPDASRSSARHTVSGLTFESLIRHSALLLKDSGSLSVIIPKEAQNRFHTLCNENHLTLVKQTDVKTVVRKHPKRVMLKFVKGIPSVDVERTELVLMENGQRTEQYSLLCKEFYL